MKIAKIVILSAILSGCANLNTVGRTTQLPGGGVAIHLDAPQRLVYANPQGSVCAEPTPDALQSYASAIGAGVSVSDKGAASLSDAISANAQSVGLHTQSITLMRETLYRICEYSHNPNATPLQVVQLLQRSQDLTLGILAIEQLTGAVVARQAALTSNSSANAAASINNTQAQLDTAQKNEDAKKAAMDTAKNEEETSGAKLADLQGQLDTETGKVKADQDAAKISDLNNKVADQRKANHDAIATSKTAQLNYNEAVTSTKTIKSLLGAAITNAQASTTGSSSFSESQGTKNVDKDTAEKLSLATVSIVSQILNKGHLTDTCMNFLTSIHSDKSPNPNASPDIFQNVIRKCNDVIADSG